MTKQPNDVRALASESSPHRACGALDHHRSATSGLESTKPSKKALYPSPVSIVSRRPCSRLLMRLLLSQIPCRASSAGDPGLYAQEFSGLFRLKYGL